MKRAQPVPETEPVNHKAWPDGKTNPERQ